MRKMTSYKVVSLISIIIRMEAVEHKRRLHMPVQRGVDALPMVDFSLCFLSDQSLPLLVDLTSDD